MSGGYRTRPPSGSMVYWRRAGSNADYKFGYVTYESGQTLVRMGRFNGDDSGGSVVDTVDVEWRTYTGKRS